MLPIRMEGRRALGQADQACGLGVMNEARTTQLWGKWLKRGKDRLQTDNRGGMIGCTGLIHDAQPAHRLCWGNAEL